MTTIEATADGNSLLHTKSDISTYWEPGRDIHLLWGVTDGPEGIYASDPRGRWDGVDEYPDDVRINRTTGRIESRTWYVSRDGRVPYLLMPRSFPVPSSHSGLQRYYTEATWGRRWGADIPWSVRYEWAGPLLRVVFDEELEARAYHEDWYFERGYGPVKIEQWHDQGRTSLKIRIER
jgi:hypothetical protein